MIPTLNEADWIERTLRHLQMLQPSVWEIIVVDGGSQDKTVTIARSINNSVNLCENNSVNQFENRSTNFSTDIKIVSANSGRAVQMNQGAEVATGEILCFLHADTMVPDDLVTIVETTLSNPTIACGGFISLMVGKDITRWGISLHNYLKTYYAPLLFRPHLFFGKGLRLLFGDQVMFCRRTDFWQCGGFDAIPIMEEANLCLKLTRLGRIHLVNRVVQSSDRRVAKWGALKANAIYLFIGSLWGLGVPAATLKRFYEEVR